MARAVPADVASERVVLFSSALPGWTPERVVGAAASLGVPGVEWGAGPGEAVPDRRAAERARVLTAAAGMAVSGFSVQDPDARLGATRSFAGCVRLAVELGAPHIRLFAAPYAGGGWRRAQARAQAGLDRLVDLCGPAGLRVLVETAPDTLAPTPSHAVELVRRHPPRLAGVLYDPGNMIIEGHVDPRVAVAELGPYLRHVHVKNVLWRPTRGTWRWDYASLAEGMLDWAKVAGALAEARYRGAFAVDHLAGRPSGRKLRAESQALRALLGRAYR